MKTLHLLIHGRVQGVGFRYAVLEEASRIGVGGWVRNRRDGCVEAMLHGDDDRVERMLDWCRCGPPAARVVSVDVDRAEGSFDSFEMRETI